MKWIRIGLILLILVLLCSGGMWLTLRVTAEYPELGEAVSYPVNQMDGFTLTILVPLSGVYNPVEGYGGFGSGLYFFQGRGGGPRL